MDLDAVGTDPANVLQAYDDGHRFMHWFNASWYGERATARPARGCAAPPLDGAWATAPYLHNGSIPSIAALLTAAIFGHTGATISTHLYTRLVYKARDLGWVCREWDRGNAENTKRAQRPQIYDTTLCGCSNEGHTYGDRLSVGEREAVLEHLKTL